MIIYNDRGDVSLFSSEQAMLEYVEPIDIEESPAEVITEVGESIQLSLLPTGSVKLVKRVASEKAKARFQKLLKRYVKSVLSGRAISVILRDDEIVMKIAEKFYTDR